MHRFIYKFAIFVSILSVVGALLNGVSIMTTLIRAGLVFLGTLLLFIVFLNIMRWAIASTTIIEQHAEESEKEKEMRGELVKKMKNGLKENKAENQLIGENK